MHVTNAEFDATVGDLKATLDNLAIPTAEQKELLAIIESTRRSLVLSLIVLSFDHRTLTARVLNAGHLVPLLIRPQGILGRANVQKV